MSHTPSPPPASAPEPSTPSSEGRLTRRQERFVAEYLVDLNATRAAIRAGYKDGPGIRHTGHRLLTNADVAREIEQRRRTVLSKRVMTAEEVLEEQTRIGTSDIGNCYDERGNLIPIHLLPVDVRRCIASTKTVIRNVSGGDGHTDTVVELKFWPKPDALQYLGRWHGQDVQKIQVTGDLFARLDEGRQRVAEEKAKREREARGQRPSAE